MKTNLDQMDRILEELREIARESGDLTGRLAAEVKGQAADANAPADRPSQASNGRGG